MGFQSRKRLSDCHRSNTKVQFETLEPRNMLAADFGVVDAFSSSQLTHLTNEVGVEQRVDVLRAHLGADQADNFQLISTTNDQLGFEHFKYQHFRNGLPVESNHYTVHAKDGLIVSLSGEYTEVTAAASKPSISELAALQSALDFVNAEIYVWQDIDTATTLGEHGHADHNLENGSNQLDSLTSSSMTEYGPAFDRTNLISFELPEADLMYAGDRLAYRFDVYAIQPLSRDWIYIDATNGDVIDSVTRIHSFNVPGSGPSLYDGNVDFTADFTGTEYQLRETGIAGAADVRTFSMNNGTDYSMATDFTNTTAIFNDAEFHTGNQTHWGTEQVRDYFLNKHNRNSFDDAGTALRSYVSYRTDYVNAFWNGSFMTYGDGNSSRGPLVSLDIAGHELAHGVTQFTAGLIYRDQSGALNESFSDIFGEASENYARGSNDWLMGGDIGINGNTGQFRNMANPNQFNHADTYLGDYWRSDNSDVGGVHRNSGVQNKWFYIMVNGEAGTNDTGHTYNVTGVGLDDAASIAYRNLSTYLSSNSTFPDARLGAVQSAIDLFGVGSQQHVSTMEAWDAVGVYELQDVLQLEAVQPLGSLVYADSVVAEVEYATDVHEFVLPLDTNQSMSLTLRTVTGGLIPTVTVLSPSGLAVGTASAGTSADTVTFHSLPVTEDGEYLIQVTGVIGDDGIETFGTFAMDIQMNASYEFEQLALGTNDVIGDAQPLEVSSLGLGDLANSTADRLAVIGVLGEFDTDTGSDIDGENFESGDLNDSWEIFSSTANGRIEVTDDTGTPDGLYALSMDVSVNGLFNLNEAIWTLDLTDVTEAVLNWSETSFGDEIHLLPSIFGGSYFGDGVSISEDGLTWHTISTATLPNGFWQNIEVDLVQVAEDANIELGADFKIKFQQYDNFGRSSDGRAYDNISFGGAEPIPNVDWFSFDLEPNVPATVGLTQVEGDVAQLTLELFDADENLLAAGLAGPHIHQYVENFSHTGTDPTTLFVKVSGGSDKYSLVVTRDSTFDLGAGVQDLTNVNGVLGYVSTNIEVGAEPDAADSGVDVSTFFNGVTLSNGVTGGAIFAVATNNYDAPTGDHVFSFSATNDDGFRGPYENNNGDSFAGNEFRADFDSLQSFVSIDVGSDDTLDVAFLRAFDVGGNLLQEVIGTGAAHSQSETLSISRNSADISYITSAGMSYNAGSRLDSHTVPLDNLIFEENVTNTDVYSIDAIAGEALEFTAYVPGEGPYEFRNRLVDDDGRHLLMTLFDSAGTEVASSIAAISYVPAADETYELVVSATNGDGEYYISRSIDFVTRRFDFGSEFTVLVDDWSLADDADYTTEQGFGWLGQTRGLQAGKFGTASTDYLAYDGITVSIGTFVVDLPNGEYDVTLYHGQSRHADKIELTLEGVAYVSTPRTDEIVNFQVSIADGQFTFQANGLRDLYPFVHFAAMEITRVMSRDSGGSNNLTGGQDGNDESPNDPLGDLATAFSQLSQPAGSLDNTVSLNTGNGRSIQMPEAPILATDLRWEAHQTLKALYSMSPESRAAKLSDPAFDQTALNKTGVILAEILDESFDFRF